MGASPMSAIDSHRLVSIVENRVDEERRSKHSASLLHIFVDGITEKAARSDSRASAGASIVEIDCEKVIALDCFSRCKSRKRRLAASGETREIVKSYRACENHMIGFYKTAIDLYGSSGRGCAESGQLTGIVRLVIDGFNSLEDRIGDQLPLLLFGRATMDSG